MNGDVLVDIPRHPSPTTAMFAELRCRRLHPLRTYVSVNRPMMLGDILGEVFSAIIGDALLGWLWPHRPKQPWPPPEGQWNASLGSVAGFLGGLSVLFVAAVAIVIAQGRQDDVPVLTMLGVGLLSAFLGAALARRTYLVSSRRHQFAAIGLWCSRASIAVGILAIVVLLRRAGLPSR